MSDIQGLRDLPRSERRDALEALVVTEFRTTLLLTDAEDLPLDQSFFEMGLTSLRLTEIKQRLEERLACGISANDLFNSPTIEQLLVYITDQALPDLFHAPAEATTAAAEESTAQKSAVDDLLANLYQA